MKRANAVLRGGAQSGDAEIALDYDGRFLRRKRLGTSHGDVLVDLPEVTSLDQGDALALDDGSRLAIVAAPEPVIEAKSGDLARLAWHMGNRHAPCEILADALRLRFDPVLERLLVHLGAEVTRQDAPFQPEGGAYGHGRTFSHDHRHETETAAGHHHHDHSHDLAHDGHSHG